RYFLLGGHYRSQLQFSMESLKGAQNSRRSLIDKLKTKFPHAEPSNLQFASSQRDYNDVIKKYLEAFDKAIEDDLNTPRALAELWGLLKDAPASEQALSAVFDMDSVLGLGLEEALKNSAESGEDEDLSKEIEELIIKRTEAKKAKDFAMADKIRQDLKDRGIILEDSPSGTTWKRG
ncbi:MAG: cysteine--tRNA ligase, partial [Treponema sp.]|nr:cysteine--tRNA ligase [Treponema sp.]